MSARDTLFNRLASLGIETATVPCLMRAAQLNFHPLVSTESTGIARQGLLDFIASCGHAPLIVDFDAMVLADAEAATLERDDV